MPSKKPAAKKATRAKKRGGLTSALGAKGTTALVICVIAGGLVVGARDLQQREQLKAKEAAAAMGPDGANDIAPVEASKRSSKAATSTTIASKTASTGTVAAAPKSTVSVAANHAVTVTGCLERSDEGYRLKDTSGDAAPKSRSWKSGFLKKGAASVDVVDSSHTLALNSHVGHRVAVSGPLTDREMRAESVQRVAASCRAN